MPREKVRVINPSASSSDSKTTTKSQDTKKIDVSKLATAADNSIVKHSISVSEYTIEKSEIEEEIYSPRDKLASKISLIVE